jgi:beta-glucosidase
MDIKELIGQMTLAEKAALLTGAQSMYTAGCERLSVPRKRLADGPHGVRSYIPGTNCVTLPSMCALGATWNREAALKTGQIIARDCIHHGLQMILGPGLNIKRDALNGRNFEYVSEDPVLTGEIAGAFVKGCEELGIATSMKHFALNSQETNRTENSAEVDERTLREIYLRGFEIAVREGHPTSVMCAYNKINSIWCSENKCLLTEILKGDWGYDGLVVSDWGAVHDEAKAVAAGLDLRMPDNPNMPALIEKGIRDGVCTEEDVDKAAARVLKFLFKPIPKEESYDRDAQHKAAQEVAAEAITLLRNRDQLLPLTPEKYKKICVTGEYAVKPYINGQGSAEVFTDAAYIDSPLECLRRNLPGVQVEYCDYLTAKHPDTMLWHTFMAKIPEIRAYDAVIVFTGVQPSQDSENLDRNDNHLMGYIENVLHNVVLHNPNAILVLTSGSSTFRSVEADRFPAIVQAWPTGEGAGKAVADVLTGAVNPSGKLSETFPVKMRADIDVVGDGLTQDYSERWRVGYRYYDLHPEQIWFPFGHGLSYTGFTYTDLCIEKRGEAYEVAFTLENSGVRDGSEAVQLYVADPVSTASKPLKELVCFDKIFLRAGEKKSVSFTLTPQDLAYYNVMLHRWIAESGRYDILIAASSRDIRLSGSIVHDNPHCYSMRKMQEDQIG